MLKRIAIKFFCLFGYHNYSCAVDTRRIVTRGSLHHIRFEFKPECRDCNKEFKWVRRKYFDEFYKNHMYQSKRTKGPQ